MTGGYKEVDFTVDEGKRGDCVLLEIKIKGSTAEGRQKKLCGLPPV